MSRSPQRNPCGSDFPHHLPLRICAQRHTFPDLREGGQIPILIGPQNGHRRSPSGMQAGEELHRHPFTIHNDLTHVGLCSHLFIECDDGR